MDPFRTAGFRCPTCAGEAPLREYQDRLCCDECGGMLIDETDFAASCADLAMRDIEPVFTDEQPTERTCPRCERAFLSAQVTLTPTKTKATVLRCAADGVWLTDTQLAAVFQRVGTATRAGRAARSGRWRTRRRGAQPRPAKGS